MYDFNAWLESKQLVEFSNSHLMNRQVGTFMKNQQTRATDGSENMDSQRKLGWLMNTIQKMIGTDADALHKLSISLAGMARESRPKLPAPDMSRNPVAREN